MHLQSCCFACSTCFFFFFAVFVDVAVVVTKLPIVDLFACPFDCAPF